MVKERETDEGKVKGSGGEKEDEQEKAVAEVENDDQPLTEIPPEVNQESTTAHLLSPPTQPSQASDPDPNSTYALALKNAEIQIEQIIYARISRILHLFQLHQTSQLILGPFDTSVFHIDLIASIFADLLIKPGGRFKDIFQTVIFAIPREGTRRVFSEVFSRVDKQA